MISPRTKGCLEREVGSPLELISPLPTGLGVGAREVLAEVPSSPGKGVGKATSSDLTITTAKDNIPDGLHVEMSARELTLGRSFSAEAQRSLGRAE